VNQMENFVELAPGLLLDIRSVDAEHLELADLLNRLAGLQPGDAAAGDGVSNGTAEADGAAQLLALLDQLEAETRAHFASEEQLMQEAAYPAWRAHRREHTMLMAELRCFVREIHQGAGHLQLRDLLSLKQWLVGHIAGADRKFADFYHTGSMDDPGPGPIGFGHGQFLD